MVSLIAYKVDYHGSLLNDLPAELKYRVLDFLDPISLKKCRLLNKVFQESIDNCEKYYKHWVLDIDGLPVSDDQDFVKLLTNSSIKFGSFFGSGRHSNQIFETCPEFFEKLGKTVTEIVNLPFKKMDLWTTEALILNFDKVEYLKINGNHLLCNMQKLNIVWPSVKRLTIFCSVDMLKYNGDYSEFPNVEEIILEINCLIDTYNQMIKVCPQKITGVRDIMFKFLMADISAKLSIIPANSLKELTFKYTGSKNQKELLKNQTAIKSYKIWYELVWNKNYGEILPKNVNPLFVKSLTIELKSPNLTFDLMTLESLPRLTRFHLKIDRAFDDFRCEEPNTCFLHRHFPCTILSVTQLYIELRRLYEYVCLKCIRALLKSFPNVEDLFIQVELHNKFYKFWKMFNTVLKQTRCNLKLNRLEISNGDSNMIIDINDYKFLKVMAPLPYLTQLLMHIGLTGFSQNQLKSLCDKCPGLKSLDLSILTGFDFCLSGFLIHQLKDLRQLKFTDYSYLEKKDESRDEDDIGLCAPEEVINVLLNVPLKLWELDLPIDCSPQSTFPLFEKFETLRKIYITDPLGSKCVSRNSYYIDDSFFEENSM